MNSRMTLQTKTLDVGLLFTSLSIKSKNTILTYTILTLEIEDGKFYCAVFKFIPAISKASSNPLLLFLDCLYKHNLLTETVQKLRATRKLFLV